MFENIFGGNLENIKFPFTEKRRPFKGLKTALEYIWVSNRTVLFVVQVLASDKNVLNFGRI